MPKGPVFEAVDKGDVEASVGVIRIIANNTAPTHPPITIMIIIITHTRARTPQLVRSLLASGIKPDAERDRVSLFWCRSD